MTKLHLIMPMGGRGQRFFENGFVIPKPLIEINGRPFFYWSAMSVLKYIPDCDITFVVLKEHIEEFDIKNKVLSYFPDAEVVVIERVLAGAVLTCMAGSKTINDDIPVIFNDCDHMFGCSELAKRLESGLDADGALLTFKADSPKFSYAKTNADGFVEKTVEKQVISNDAICGAYYFKNRSIFEENAGEYLDKCDYTEYFMSGVYNCMADKGLKSVVCPVDFHISFGTPQEYYEAENSEKFGEFI